MACQPQTPLTRPLISVPVVPYMYMPYDMRLFFLSCNRGKRITCSDWLVKAGADGGAYILRTSINHVSLSITHA